MLAFAARVLIAAGNTVPCVAVTSAGLANSRAGAFVSRQVARRTVGITGSRAVLGWVGLRTVAAEDAATNPGIVREGMLGTKG